MTTCSTHVLDAALGVPAQGIGVHLSDDTAIVESATTDADGRVRFDVELGAGIHTLMFETGEWFAAAGRDTFYPAVGIAFTVDDQPHVHVPLLLGPYSYTTYRGS